MKEVNSFITETNSGEGKYQITYETNSRKNYEFVEEICRLLIDRNNMFRYKDKIDKIVKYIGLTYDDMKLYNNYDVNGVEIYKILNGEDNENE